MTIKGVNRVKKILANGTVMYYYYTARKGGERFFESKHKPVKQPYPHAFIERWREATKPKKRDLTTFDGLCAGYLKSTEYTKLRAPETRSRFVEKARQKFGKASLAVLVDPRFRADLIEWRDSLAGSPRSADLSIEAVSAVLNYARDCGLMTTNPALGIRNLYAPPNDKSPWTDQQIEQFTEGCPQYLLDAFWLMRHFALRRTDAISITWNADKGTHLSWKTSKSARKREAVIPVLPEARAFLDDLRKRNTASTTMLVAGRGQPWKKAASLTKAFAKRWRDMKVEDFPSPHRLRNNAATQMMIAGIDDRTIADVMGWTVADVEDMRRVYVDREAVVSAAVVRLRSDG